MIVLSVVAAILAAASNAAGTVFQRRAALTVPDADAMRIKLMVDMIRHPSWLIGMVCVVLAAGLQALALATGPLALVQPVFVLELVFTMIFIVPILKRALPSIGWWGVGFIVVGLGLALACANPSGGSLQAPMVLWVPVLVGCLGAVGVLCAVALKRANGPVRAACLGSATAIAYALTAALMKSSTDTLDRRGFEAFLSSWQTYGFALVGVCGLFLLENAMQAGPLIASQPALTLGDALISTSLGVVLYNEHIRTGWWLVPELAGVALVVLGVLALARTDALAAAVQQQDDAPPDGLRTSGG